MSLQGSSTSVYNELRLEGKLCDAIVKAEDVEFQIHKIILCNCSPYFRALFTCWSTEDRKVFNVSNLSPLMMELIIQFAYTGSVMVTEDNVQDLLLAANMLNVVEIVQTCSNFLSEHLCPENCVSIWQFTNICFCPELRHRAHRYIVHHFMEVVFQDEFLQLSVQELTDILERDDLNVKKESTVFEAILRWISHLPEEREGHIAVLLSKVRLALSSEEYVKNTVLSNKLVSNNNECLEIANDAIQTIGHMVRNSPLISELSYRLARPRLPDAVLLAIGGWSSGNPSDDIEVYNVRTDCWVNITNNLMHPRAYHGAVFLNEYVYCVGGFDGVEHFNTVHRFDLSTHTWHEAAPMHCRRCYVSVTVLNGWIYAMGGFDGQTRLRNAERYRPETNQWSLIAPMQEHRSDASCTTLHSKIYICGGFNGNQCLETAEYYNPDTNQWTMITPMNSRRSGIGVIAYVDHVYAVGGFDGNNRLQSAEAYNPQTNAWQAASSMLTPRSNFGIEVIDDLLFVVGGFNGATTTYKVEYYDVTMNVWFEACRMEIYRSALSCCVVPRLPNMTEYTFPHASLPLFHLDEVDEVEEVEEPVDTI
ncbi:Kelch-like protein 10 [Channa argus]|uniref:Kelch-like protein 10 n=1 Tax=Channa argus TaxID=215402 RepID=A0A6G1PW80_CHAAH|nr:Kelch-like protein 10 [Channa argus]